MLAPDMLLIDGVGVQGTAGAVGVAGTLVKSWHNGNVRRYLAALLFGTAVLLGVLYLNPKISRSDLMTITSVETIAAHPRLRESIAGLDGAARACEAVARIFDDGDPHTGVYHLLANQLSLLDREPARAGRANSLAFRLKLLLAAGFAPQLAGCASCGEREHLVGFSGAAGGVVCGACEASAFPLDEDAHAFMVAALGRPLAETPDAPPLALAQAERAITETLEHHAHLRLRPVGSR